MSSKAEQYRQSPFTIKDEDNTVVFDMCYLMAFYFKDGYKSATRRRILDTIDLCHERMRDYFTKVEVPKYPGRVLKYDPKYIDELKEYIDYIDEDSRWGVYLSNTNDNLDASSTDVSSRVTSKIHQNVHKDLSYFLRQQGLAFMLTIMAPPGQSSFRP